jgi:hypothetical protein
VTRHHLTSRCRARTTGGPRASQLGERHLSVEIAGEGTPCRLQRTPPGFFVQRRFPLIRKGEKRPVPPCVACTWLGRRTRATSSVASSLQFDAAFFFVAHRNVATRWQAWQEPAPQGAAGSPREQVPCLQKRGWACVGPRRCTHAQLRRHCL